MMKIQLFHHRNKLHFKIYSNREQSVQKCNNISQHHCFYCSFDHINAALLSIRDFFQKLKKNPTNSHKLLNSVRYINSFILALYTLLWAIL